MRNMDHKELVAALNEMVSNTEHDQHSDIGPYWLHFDSRGLTFFNEDAQVALNTLVSSFWQYRRDLYDTLSEQTVYQRLLALIRDLSASGRKADKNVVKSFFTELTEIPEEEWDVFQRLHGVVSILGDPLQLGPYHIYQWSQHKQLIRTEYGLRFAHMTDGDSHWATMWCDIERDDATLIRVRVRAREASRARDRAVIKFQQFESAIRFMLGPSEHFDVGVFDYRRSEILQTIAFSATSSGFESRLIGAVQPIDLRDPFFVRSKLGHDVIWDLLNKSDHSDLQKKIVSAVEWAGKAVRDPDPTKSFVQIMFGIEALLKFDKQGESVKPSITNQISDFTAFILGTNYNSRIEYYYKMSKLYGKRSKIAHGSGKSVTPLEVTQGFYILRDLIRNILTSTTLCKFTSLNELSTWVNSQKYS